MSEYQYYEFQAIDRLLSMPEREALRAISSRAQISAASFTNVYSHGDLRGNPLAMLEKYFDAFIYLANWGSRQFALRLPRQLVDVEMLSRYSGECMTLKPCAQHIILDCCVNELETDSWVKGEGWLGGLISLRSDILAGDLRGLYLGWLLSVWNSGMDEKTVSPPVPPGLSELSAPLGTFVEFFGLNKNLVRAAAQWSATQSESPQPATGLALLTAGELLRLAKEITEGTGSSKEGKGNGRR